MKRIRIQRSLPATLTAAVLTRAARVSLAIVGLAVMSLTSCSTADDILDPDGPKAGDTYLTLSTATINGTTTRATSSGFVSEFKAGDVIRVGYSFSNTTKEEAYARMNPDGATWEIYSDLEFTTPVQLYPNPANPAESWEAIDLRFNFDPVGVVTGTDGKKTYGGTELYQDETSKLYTCHDRLFASIKRTTTGDLAAGEYRVATGSGRVSVRLKHENALLSLPEGGAYLRERLRRAI